VLGHGTLSPVPWPDTSSKILSGLLGDMKNAHDPRSGQWGRDRIDRCEVEGGNMPNSGEWLALKALAH
jgi:hypothetical protein